MSIYRQGGVKFGNIDQFKRHEYCIRDYFLSLRLSSYYVTLYGKPWRTTQNIFFAQWPEDIVLKIFHSKTVNEKIVNFRRCQVKRKFPCSPILRVETRRRLTTLKICCMSNEVIRKRQSGRLAASFLNCCTILS